MLWLFACTSPVVQPAPAPEPVAEPAGPPMPDHALQYLVDGATVPAASILFMEVATLGTVQFLFTDQANVSCDEMLSRPGNSITGAWASNEPVVGLHQVSNVGPSPGRPEFWDGARIRIDTFEGSGVTGVIETSALCSAGDCRSQGACGEDEICDPRYQTETEPGRCVGPCRDGANGRFSGTLCPRYAPPADQLAPSEE